MSNGDIWTSSDSGATWTDQTGSGARDWEALTSSSDGSKLAAAEFAGDIWTSADGGVSWTDRSGPGVQNWFGITSSADGTHLAAVAKGGDIWTSSDSGATWTDQTLAGTQQWTAIASSADGTMLAATVHNGDIWTSANSGVNWTDRASAGATRWTAIASSADGLKIIEVENIGTIMTSTDGGANWTDRSSGAGWPLWAGMWSAVTSSSDGTRLAVVDQTFRTYGYGGDIWTSTDSGATWTDQSSGGLRTWDAITSSSDGLRILAADSGNASGSLYLSTDGGSTWTEEQIPAQNYWGSAAISDDGLKLAAIVEPGGIYTSTDGGSSWTSHAETGTFDWSSITSSSDGTKLAATENNIWTSGDSGATWTNRTRETPDYGLNINGIAASSDGSKIVFAPQSGYIYTSADHGVTWTRNTSLGTGILWKGFASSADGTNLVAVANGSGVISGDSAGSYIYTSSDSGTTWTARTAPGRQHWKTVASSSNGADLVAATYSGSLDGHAWTSTDSGVSWSEQAGSPLADWSSLTSSSDGTKLAAIIRNGSVLLATSTDSGVTWITRATPGTNAQAVASDADGLGLILATPTAVYTSADAGSTWTARAGAGSHNWTSVSISANGQTMEAVGSTFGDIYTSTDGGVSWTNQTAASDSWLWSTVSADGSTWIAVAQRGDIAISTDSGSTWTFHTPAGPHAFTAIASSPDGTKLAAVSRLDGQRTSDGGTVWTSTDSGVTWQQKTGAGYRFWDTVAISSDGQKIAAAVGASSNTGDIWTTADGGATWVDRSGAGTRQWGSLSSSADGTKIAASEAGGSIQFSTDSGASWAPLSGIPSSSGYKVVVSGDGSTIVAADANTGNILTSTDGGSSWSTQPITGAPSWSAIRSSSDATSLVAAAFPGDIWTLSAPSTSAPTVTTSVPSGVSVTSATGNGSITATGGDTPTIRGFVYGTSLPYTATSSENGSFAVGAYTGDITGLTCATDYHIAAYAMNTVGYSYGSDETFTTGACPKHHTSIYTPPGTMSTPISITTPIPVVAPTTVPSPKPPSRAPAGQTSPNLEPSASSIPSPSTNALSAPSASPQAGSHPMFKEPGPSIGLSTALRSTLLKVGTFAIQGMGLVGGLAALVLDSILLLEISSLYDLWLVFVRMLETLAAFLGLRRRRDRSWGTVYDAVTKRPLDPALVTIVDEADRGEGERITDMDGRYGFLPKPGSYTMHAAKTHYRFPSQIAAGKVEDVLYRDLYTGGTFKTEEDEVVVKNIPMDPLDFDWNEFQKDKEHLYRFYRDRQKRVAYVSYAFFAIGFVAASVIAYLYPTGYNFAIMALYALVLVLRLTWMPKHKARALVNPDGAPFAFAILRIADTVFKGPPKAFVADRFGRLYLLFSPGTYCVTIEEPLPDGAYRMVYANNAFEMPRGVLENDIVIDGFLRDTPPFPALTPRSSSDISAGMVA